MNKIIFLTTTKPFNDVFGFRQVNSITSWIKLKNIETEVYVFTEEDIKKHFDESVRDFVNIVNDFEKSEDSRIPTFRSMWDFGCSKIKSENDLVCYLNSDILITSSFSETVNSILQQIKDKKFGIFGQRVDWSRPQVIDFNSHNWDQILTEKEKDNLTLHPACGADFFIGNKNTLGELPFFYVGRPNYDRWLVKQIIDKCDFSIDISKTATLIHHDHGYGENGDTTHIDVWQQYQKEVSVNQSRDFYPVQNIDESKHLTSLENNSIIIKTRN